MLFQVPYHASPLLPALTKTVGVWGILPISELFARPSGLINRNNSELFAQNARGGGSILLACPCSSQRLRVSVPTLSLAPRLVSIPWAGRLPLHQSLVTSHQSPTVVSFHPVNILLNEVECRVLGSL